MKYVSAFMSVVFGVLTVLFAFSCFAVVTGIAPTAIPIVLEHTREYSSAKWQLLGQDVGSFLALVVFFSLYSFFDSLYHRLNKRRRDTFDANGIKGPFVLYLRSFIADKTTRKRISFLGDIRSEEEVLVEVLSDIAPVYAIGDPSDKSMPLGASRIYVEDDKWKSVVADMAKRAVVVVLRLGETDSFWWEVEMASRSIPTDKMLFVVPECRTFNNVAMLYKILMENGIGIKSLDVSVEKKSRGSISSFLFFGQDGSPVARSVETPHFTQLVLSYENILRNALADFMARFGLHAGHRRTVRLARIFEAILIVGALFMVVPTAVSHYLLLKYQMPYELLEKCVEHHEFVEKYSGSINGGNLVRGIVESVKGSLWLDDEKYKFLFATEILAVASMEKDEFRQSMASPKNMLLMIKKYVPENYDNCVGILADAAILAVRHPKETGKLIESYKQQTNSIPQWIVEFPNDNSDNSIDEQESAMRFGRLVADHMGDKGIVDILKTLRSQSIRNVEGGGE